MQTNSYNRRNLDRSQVQIDEIPTAVGIIQKLTPAPRATRSASLPQARNVDSISRIIMSDNSQSCDADR